MDRQGIHIGPQPDSAIALTRTQEANNADTFMHLKAQITQDLRDTRLGAMFLKAEFRGHVEFAPKLGQVAWVAWHRGLPLGFATV
jgi:hypothetical protein